MNRKLRFGMIGGGRGAFIGAVHRLAAAMDGQARSLSPERSRATDALAGFRRGFLPRSHPRLRELCGDGEGRIRDADRRSRLDFVVIVTPNHEHFGPARLFLEAGFNVSATSRPRSTWPGGKEAPGDSP